MDNANCVSIKNKSDFMIFGFMAKQLIISGTGGLQHSLPYDLAVTDEHRGIDRFSVNWWDHSNSDLSLLKASLTSEQYLSLYCGHFFLDF